MYEMFGALLALGMSARRQDDLRKVGPLMLRYCIVIGMGLSMFLQGVLLRTLRSLRTVLWLDDWQCLPEHEQKAIAELIKDFPANVRVIITCRFASPR